MRWAEFEEPEKEIKHCQDALDKDPNDADAHYKLGTVYFYLSDFDKAMGCCKKALALKPRNTTFLAFNSYLCTKIEDHEGAIEALIELIELGADESDYHVDIAQEAQCGMDKEYALLMVYRLRSEGKDSVADKLEKWLVAPFGQIKSPQRNNNEK